jgi:signal transduction histidine kinase
VRWCRAEKTCAPRKLQAFLYGEFQELLRQSNSSLLAEESMGTSKVAATTGSSFAPLANWREHDHRAHVAQFYAEDEFLVDSTAQFIGAALGAGDAAVVVATQAHRDGFARRLKSRGLDVTAAIAQGRYVSLDAAETLSALMLDGWPDAARFAEIVGTLIARVSAAAKTENPRVAVFGEMVALLWAAGKGEAAIRLEELWNDLGKTQSFSLRCGYPIKEFNRSEHGESFLRICEAHSDVIPGESYASGLSEDKRLRNITHLQQRAQALENEIDERKRVEQALRQAHDELERRVMERTAELQRKNLQIEAQAATLESANQGLRQLSAHLLRVQDEERRRMARDLHDSTGQILALLSMNLSALETEAQKLSPELAQSIAENTAIANQVSSELRTMSYLLHPPLLDEMGLESALRWYVEGFAQRSGVKVSLQSAGDFARLSRDLETAIFRVVQECLTNIHRHSGSPVATIRLCQSVGTVTLEVEDAGKGIATEMLAKVASSGVSGLGLRGMRERIKDFGGELEIASSQNGTHIKVIVPLELSAPEPRLSGPTKSIGDVM